MKNTKINVTLLSNEEMLNHKASEYNRVEWIKRVNRYIDLKAKFYEAKPDSIYDYSRFFTQYTIDEGLYLLNSFSPYSSSITNHGFTRAFIFDGEIHTKGFGENNDQRIVNTKDGRKWMAENICNRGIMVTNCL